MQFYVTNYSSTVTFYRRTVQIRYTRMHARAPYSLLVLKNRNMGPRVNNQLSTMFSDLMQACYSRLLPLLNVNMHNTIKH